MKRKVLAAVAAWISVAVIGLPSLPAHKDPTANWTAATIQFLGSRTGIFDDDQGVYSDGVSRVECRIYNKGTPATNDFTLNLNFSNPSRTLNYVDPEATFSLTEDKSFVNVNNIGSMNLNETKNTAALFATSVGDLRFSCGTRTDTSGCIQVTRTGAGTWNVSTTTGTAALYQSVKGKYSLRGYVNLPFQATVATK